MQSIKVIKPLKDKADEHLLARLKNGDESVLTFIYKEYSRAFVKWSGQQFSSDDEVAKDAFQEAVIALHSNVVKGKLTELTSTLKTYLFSIGRNLVLKKLNYDSRFTGTETLATHSDSTSERMELNERQQLVVSLLKETKQPCRSILKLFYLKSYAMESIAENLGYKDDKTVKTLKLRCMKELKERVKKAV